MSARGDSGGWRLQQGVEGKPEAWMESEGACPTVGKGLGNGSCFQFCTAGGCRGGSCRRLVQSVCA
eukprot:3658078-Rhodomonas_salina.1